jgi:hypothetical protein
MGKIRYSYTVLAGKSEGKRTLGRPRLRWVDNIKTDLTEIVSGGVECTDAAQVRDRWWALVNTIMDVKYMTDYQLFKEDSASWG